MEGKAMKQFTYRIKVSTGASFSRCAFAANKNQAYMEVCYELNTLGIFPEETITSISLIQVGEA